MNFRSVFLAVAISFALIVSAFLINRARPKVETEQPGGEFVRASGKCAECHSRTQYSVVHEYEMSKHAQTGVNCLECHQPASGQQKEEHHGFVISADRLTAGNCRGCHEQIYQQFLRSRHAVTSWAAVYGDKGLSPEQVNFSETYQPGGTKRPPHPFVTLEGGSAIVSGCEQCHAIGKPNGMEPSEPAPTVIPVTPVQWPSRGRLALVGSVIWGQTIRRSRSTRNRSMD